MEECLAYFRKAIAGDPDAPHWPEWWAANWEKAEQVFSLVDFVRLKHRGLLGAEQILRKRGELGETSP